MADEGGSMDLDIYKDKLNKVLEHLKTELASIRTGRATPSLVENIQVEAYDQAEPMPLKQLAAITVPQPRQILVEPWDKSTLKQIEKAIAQSNMGFNIANDGNVLRLSIPVMTEEMKKGVLKNLHDKLEQARISVRRIRDDIKEDIIKEFKESQISEDDKFRLLDKLDEMIREYTDTINEMGKKKEEEIEGV